MEQIVAFLKESRDEFLHVTWPTRAETLRLTLVVIVVSLVVGGFVGGLDFVFTNVMNALLGR